MGVLPKAWWLAAAIQLWTGAREAWPGEGSSPALHTALEMGFRAELERVNVGQVPRKSL